MHQHQVLHRSSSLGKAAQHRAPTPRGGSGIGGRMPAAPAVAASAKQRRKFAPGRVVVGEPVFLQLQADGSDVWRLERAVELLKSGGIGIVPTDSLPAVVADLENRDAVAKLYLAMALSPKKRLSVLCRSFQDISHYTAGFRPALAPGQPDTFTAVRRMLPGPFTLIMPASKNLPPLVDPEKGKKQARKAVGVRIPSDPVCAALLEQFGGCLLSHSVHVPEHLDDETEVPDPGTLLDLYGNAGLDFIVDTGPRVATASTVIDLTGPEPELVRQGKGDASALIGGGGA